MDDTWKDYVIATYRLGGGGDWTRKAETIALGMTVGSWPGLSVERQTALQRHAGRVVDVEGGLIRIAYPLVNLTPDLPAVLTCTFGKLSMDGKIRLVDLTLPPHFAAAFPGPKLGVEELLPRLLREASYQEVYLAGVVGESDTLHEARDLRSSCAIGSVLKIGGGPLRKSEGTVTILKGWEKRQASFLGLTLRSRPMCSTRACAWSLSGKETGKNGPVQSPLAGPIWKPPTRC